MKLSIFALLLSLFSVSAQEGSTEEGPDPWVKRPPSNPDVHVKYVFPDSLDMTFPLGKQVSTLFGIINEGSSPVNVSYALGSLNSQYDNTFIIGKFKAAEYYVMVDPGEVKSFQYQFPAYTNLETNEPYNVALHVFYAVESSMYANTFFNQTVTFMDENSWIDSDTVFKFFLMIAAVLIVILVSRQAYRSVMGPAKKPSRKSIENSNKEAKAAAEKVPISADDEWLDGHIGQEKKSKKDKKKD